LALAFLFIAITLLPFGLGPELKLLRALAPGLLWVVLVMTVLVTLDRLFQEDFEDGSLDQLIGVSLPLEMVVLAKLLGHYLAVIVPLLIFVPLAGLLLNIAPAHVPGLMLALLAGTPALVLLGGIGASLAVSVRRGGLLTVLLTLPFYVPVLIFGAGATQVALGGGMDMARLGVVALISLAALFLAPPAIAAALRAAIR
jgi:heme exporter protein B